MDGHHVRRRKSSGVKPAILLCSSEPEDSDSSFGDHSVRQGLRFNGLLAASLAIPIVPASPRRMRSPLSSPDYESDGSNDAGSAQEMHLMPPNNALPPTFSPRSPRLGPIDQATKALLKEERRKSEEEERRKSETASLPVSPVVLDEKDLANGFDDPLGVNRSKTLFGDEFERYISKETRTKPDKVLPASENGVSNGEQPRRRRASSR